MAETRLRLLEKWADYRGNILQAATPDQLLQLRMAFCAGALSCYMIAVRELPEDDNEGLKILSELYTELMDIPRSIEIEQTANSIFFGSSNANPS